MSAVEREHKYKAPFDVLKLGMLDMVDLESFQVAKHFDSAEENKTEAREMANSKATTETGIKLERAMPLEKPFENTISKEQEQERLPLEGPSDVIRHINASFAHQPQLTTLQHPTNKALRATAIYPIIPNKFEPDSYAQCTFDASPFVGSVDGIKVANEGDQRALLKAMSNAEDASDTFVWYYLPMPDDDEGEKYVYHRDYDIQRMDRHQHSHFVLAVPPATAKVGEECNAYYAPISGHFNLRKRRTKSDLYHQQRHSLKVTRASSEQ